MKSFHRFLFPISFLEGIHIDFQRISGWMTFDTMNDYENLLERYLKFPVLVDEIIETLKIAIENKMTYHSYSMVCSFQRCRIQGCKNYIYAGKYGRLYYTYSVLIFRRVLLTIFTTSPILKYQLNQAICTNHF